VPENKAAGSVAAAVKYLQLDDGRNFTSAQSTADITYDQTGSALRRISRRPAGLLPDPVFFSTY
jgi:hypothetical protein